MLSLTDIAELKSLPDAHSRGAKRGVLPVGDLHQGVQHRIVKHRPPCTNLGRFALNGRFVRFHPVIWDRSGWADIIRPNHRAARRREGDSKRSKGAPEYATYSGPIAHRPTPTFLPL